jgi:prepilin-type N-terminal cleavage/methylation domain-containing protein
MSRRGLTLVEMLVTLVVFAVLATALARLMIGNSRYVSQQEALLEARQTARAAMSVVVRQVSDGGLVAAAPESVTVRVPYAFGVLCPAGHAVLAPPDSAMYASALLSGFAYQQADGTYAFDETVTVTGTTTNTTHCDADSVRLVPNGIRIVLSVSALAPSGRIFYMYQTVTYKFAESAALPGRVALWRQVRGAAAEELLAPFDTASRFAFLVGSRLTVQTAVPSPLSNVRGLELRLIGASVRSAEGESAPSRFPLYPRVSFGNMLAP